MPNVHSLLLMQQNTIDISSVNPTITMRTQYRDINQVLLAGPYKPRTGRTDQKV